MIYSKSSLCGTNDMLSWMQIKITVLILFWTASLSIPRQHIILFMGLQERVKPFCIKPSAIICEPRVKLYYAWLLLALQHRYCRAESLRTHVSKFHWTWTMIAFARSKVILNYTILITLSISLSNRWRRNWDLRRQSLSSWWERTRPS